MNIVKAIKRILFVACIASMHAMQASSGIVCSSSVEMTSLGNGDYVLVCTNTENIGTFTLPQNAKAEILVVGGGGAGGSTDGKMKVAAGGGGAGGLSTRSTILEPGTYKMVVGKGGQRVQTTVQCWIGANGENSLLQMLDGQLVAIGKGGGGGGTSKIDGTGQNGGSGGGGSWFESFTRGGDGIDGQGQYGGTSTNMLVGAGGGGAAEDPSLGYGKPDGTGGSGRVMSISGIEATYSRGGRGGRCDDANYVPCDGYGFGFGGDGAANGAGGAGGNGIVVVRIKELFAYTKVPMPEYTTNFTWRAGQTCTVFDLASSSLADAVDYVEGTTQVVCSADGVATNGIGRFWFALHLKDEYRWDDGSENGSEDVPVFYWHVTEEGTLSIATISATKSVQWSEGTNAVIAINVHSTPQKIENIPNVLVLGSLCSAHAFSSDVANTALNTITKVGNVDYYFFNPKTDKTNPKYTGSLLKGETHTTSFELAQSNHGAIYGFYNKIAELIDAGKFASYDYVVFAFDRAQVATYFTQGTHAREAEVVAALKPLYDAGAVVWLVDNGKNHMANSYSASGSTVVQYPWFPTILVWSKETTWVSLYTYESSNSGDTSNYSYAPYKALMGMFAPAKYLSDLPSLDEYSDKYTLTYDNIMDLGAPDMTNTPQCVYANADDVEHLLEAVVKTKPSTIKLADAIHVGTGLNLTGASGQWTTNEQAIGWIDLTSNELTTTSNGVSISISGILDEADIKLKLEVADGGSFLTSQGATYNEKTGLWEKDPNNGPVQVSLVPDGGEVILAEAKASTTVQWSFPTYTIKGEVLYGQGEIVLNGFVIDQIEVADGTSPEVVYRGKGGYVLDYLEVDGRQIDFTKTDYSWIFNGVASDHIVKVGFKNLLTVPYPDVIDVEQTYDGIGYSPSVTTPAFLDGYDYAWKPVYAFTTNGDFSVANSQVDVVWTNGAVASTSMYVRIWIDQPGYENGVVVDSWTGVGNVTILPREVVVKFNDYVQTTSTRKTSGFSWGLYSGSLVDGDYFNDNDGTCTSYPSKGSKTEDSITSSGQMSVSTPGHDESNYIVNVLPGDYYYPEQELIAQAPDISKVYDGSPTSIVVSVVYPEGIDIKSISAGQTTYTSWVGGSMGTPSGSSRRGYTATTNQTRTATQITSATVEYSVDGGNTWMNEKPEYMDAGSYTVTYRVSCTVKTWMETQSGTLTGTRSGSSWSGYTYNWTNTSWGSISTSNQTEIEYDPYISSAIVTISKRPVEITAGSATKAYDGMPLTEPSYTIASATDATGFIDGEGLSSAAMTSDSAITELGTKPNIIDEASLAYNASTKPENYSVTCINGTLTITQNALVVNATGSEKTYDGKPADSITLTVSDKNGNVVPCTIMYRDGPLGEWTITMPDTPTDASEQVVYYKVDAGANYGPAVIGRAIVRVNQRDVVLVAADASKAYDGIALTESGFSISPECTGFVQNEGIASVVMTSASTQTKPGSAQNVIDEDISKWTFLDGTNPGNYSFSIIPGTLTVTRKLLIEVNGDGELHWTMEPSINRVEVFVVVDGKTTNRVYLADGSQTNHVMHISDEPNADGAKHVVEFIFSEDDGTLYPDNIDWKPSATEDQATSIIEDTTSKSILTNHVESGWMAIVSTNDGEVAIEGLRSPDGTSGQEGSVVESGFSGQVAGPGEIEIEELTFPNDSINIDDGKLTIVIDGREIDVYSTDCSISTNSLGQVVVSNLTITTTGLPEEPHSISISYRRDAYDLQTNTYASISHIYWKSSGEEEDGGSGWLQGHKLMIVDHSSKSETGFYLAIKPELRQPELLQTWVDRTAANGKFYLKCGATREECDSAKPMLTSLRSFAPLTNGFVWLEADLSTVTNLVPGQTTASGDLALGYWRVHIGGSTNRVDQANGADSINVFGAMRLTSETTNTLTAMPWTWYSAREEDATSIPYKKIVHCGTLTEGDYVYGAFGTGRIYKSWAVQGNALEPCNVIRKDGDGLGTIEMQIDEEDDRNDCTNYSSCARLVRASGFWMCRQNPLTVDGIPRPIYVFGQSVTSTCKTVIYAPENPDGTNCFSTIVSSPNLKMFMPTYLAFEDGGSIYKNEIPAKNPDYGWAYTPTGIIKILYPSTMSNGQVGFRTTRGWKWITWPWATRQSKTTVYYYAYPVRPGYAFWYDRRGATSLMIDWSKQSEAENIEKYAPKSAIDHESTY